MTGYKFRFFFTKEGYIRYISHLDLMRTLMRAMRRAELPLKMSQGFNPHPKLSISRALKLGVESKREEAAVMLTQMIGCENFRQRLQEQLPEGISILQVDLV